LETKPKPSRKATWSLPKRNPTLPPLQESHAEEEDYPVFESHGPVKQSFFARIFSIKPLTKMVRTTLPAEKLRNEIFDLLCRWENMGTGIVNVILDPRTNILRAKLSSHNSVGLKAMRFKIEVASVTGGSNAMFLQEKGTLPLIHNLSLSGVES
jgi:Fungal kinase associated-1 domain